MTKKIILLVTFPLLFMFACTSNSMRIASFKQKEFIVDKTKKKQMEVNYRIQLEENEDVILRTTTSCDVDAKGKKVLITDSYGNYIINYDINTGKILNFYQPKTDLSDSLALSGIRPQAYEVLNDRIMEYQTTELGKKHFYDTGKDSSVYEVFLKNQVVSSKYTASNIYSIATIRAGIYSIDSINPFRQTVGNRVCILKLDSNLHLKKLLPTQCKLKKHDYNESGKKCPKNGFFEIIGDNFYIAATNLISTTTNSFDSLTSILKFDGDLKEIEIVDFLPNEYALSKQGYKIDYAPYFTALNNEPYVAYPYGTKIKNLETGKEFELKNLPYTNKAGFDYLTKRANGFSLVSEQTLSTSNRVNLLPIRIWDIFRHKDNLVVLLAVVKELAIDDYEYDFYLQEYTTDGELVKYAELDEITKYGALEKIAYDNYHRQFLLFRKNSQNWIMEKAKW